MPFEPDPVVDVVNWLGNFILLDVLVYLARPEYPQVHLALHHGLLSTVHFGGNAVTITAMPLSTDQAVHHIILLLLARPSTRDAECHSSIPL